MFSDTAFDEHKCDIPLKTCKTIEVVYFQDGSFKDKKLMTGWGIDGVLYTFEVVPRKPIPIVLGNPTTVNMDGDSDEKLPEPVSPLYKGDINCSEQL